ncbi:ABC transporter permease subunit [Vibrio sp. JC009]|uniref:ABC transporter permease n=1 Tax=Vibrio sp. JC009 TaxID=2912314 RepID=UPI0023B03F21|nr:ABC transporter permease subunit [Vibrio sp. JC009]WED23924.1 ABC transporter permease subunit [Vibrio sp. JC009]
MNRPKLYQVTPRRIWGGIGVIGLLLIWWLLSLSFNQLVVASPWQTAMGLLSLLTTSEFWVDFLVTLQRFALSLLLGTGLGLIFGVFAGFDKRLKWLLEPLHWTLMTMPPVILVLISMLWFGMGSVQTVFVTTLLIFPLMYANTVAGIEAIDSNLIEMAHVYRASRSQMIREIYLPGIYAPLFAALTLAAGMGIRIVVLAEVLGASSGIGYAFSLSRTNVDTPALFAWILVCLILGGGLNGILFSPLKNRSLRWKGHS